MSNTTTIDPELRIALKKLRLGKMIPTLPERLLLARQNKLSHDVVATSTGTCSTSSYAFASSRARATS